MRIIRILVPALLSIASLLGSPLATRGQTVSLQQVFLGDRLCGDAIDQCISSVDFVLHRYLHVVIRDAADNADWQVTGAPSCSDPMRPVAQGQPVASDGYLEVVADLSAPNINLFDAPACLVFRGRNHWYVNYYAAYLDDSPIPDAETVYPGFRDASMRPDLPDLDVTYIHRSPSYAYDSSPNQPTPGDQVVFVAHVQNVGARPAGTFPYEWLLDGRTVVKGAADEGLVPGVETTLSLAWKWRSGPHELTFRILPAMDEISSSNNALTIRTDALALGLWVEKGAWKYFEEYQWAYCAALSCAGSDSFSDWLQRQVSNWNLALGRSLYQEPEVEHVADRVRVDQIVEVPDGSLPLHGGLASNNPDSIDHSVDLEWGITAAGVGSAYRHYWEGPFDIDWGLLHELSHARYLTDMYRFDIPLETAGAISVSAANGAPIYDAARPSAPENKLAPIRADQGNSFLYRDAERDLMVCTCEPGYSSFDAMLLNRIRGRRAVCGNANPPCNFGDWFADIPAVNDLRILDPSGRPVSDGTEVRLFFDRGTDYTGHGFDDAYVAELRTAAGMVRLPSDPFATHGDHWLQGHNLLLVEVRAPGDDLFCFIEPTTFNLADWLGYADAAHPAIYSLRVDDQAQNGCNLKLPAPRVNEPFATSPFASRASLQTGASHGGAKQRLLTIELRDDNLPANPMRNRHLLVEDAAGQVLASGTSNARGNANLRLSPGAQPTRVLDVTDNRLVIPLDSAARRTQAAPPH